MQKPSYLFILKSFILWRMLLFIPIFLAPFFFELQKNFLGGGMQNYLNNPYLWSLANFDGEHYLSIAKIWYGNGEQAFFPFYPILIKIIGDNIWTGIVISNVSFLIALLGLYKLINLDFPERITKFSIVLLLLFPSSFYFGAVYTESLFLALIVWSFYFLRTNQYFLSGLLGFFASATRVVGIILLPVYILYLIVQKKKFTLNYLPLLATPLGLLSYMYYSFKTWGDPLKFFNVASGFGEQRSDHLIMLPQVFYRYIVKIIPNLTWSYFPVVFTTLLEASVAILFLGLIILSIKKIRLDYLLYSILIYLIPTLSGSFSSLPRYVLVAFPLFVALAIMVEKQNKYLRLGIYLSLAIIAAVTQMLFVRGYFVS